MDTKFTPEFMAKIAELEAKKPENTRHQELLGTVKELVNAVNELKDVAGDKTEELSKLGDLEGILSRLADKEDPEPTDDVTPVTDAISTLQTELSMELKSMGMMMSKMELNPKITVNAPRVDVRPPEVNVNVDAPKLDDLASKLATQIEKFATSIIDSIPQTDNSGVEEKLDTLSETLSSIDTGVRMKTTFPSNIAVNNLPAVGFSQNADVTTTIVTVGSVKTITQTDGVKTCTTVIDATDVNNKSISKTWS